MANPTETGANRYASIASFTAKLKTGIIIILINGDKLDVVLKLKNETGNENTDATEDVINGIKITNINLYINRLIGLDLTSFIESLKLMLSNKGDINNIPKEHKNDSCNPSEQIV